MVKEMTLISWNVNGIRAAERKGFLEWIEKGKYDIVGIQETKISSPDQLSDAVRTPDDYWSYFHCATEKKGYSGTALYTKVEPREVKTYFGEKYLSKEGRVIEADYGDFVFLTIYFPNGGASDERLAYKMTFYGEFLEYVSGLVKAGRNVVFSGDVNTAHNEIDLSRPKENSKISGFLSVEREWMDKLVATGFADTFRSLHPDEVKYSWWDVKTRARERNIGWRIDYFFVNEAFLPKVKDAFILIDIEGSDHCPVGMRLEL